MMICFKIAKKRVHCTKAEFDTKYVVTDISNAVTRSLRGENFNAKRKKCQKEKRNASLHFLGYFQSKLVARNPFYGNTSPRYCLSPRLITNKDFR